MLGVLGAVGVGLLLAAGIVGVRLYAWLAMPSEPASAIHARWSRVEGWAALPPPRGSNAALVDAAGAFRTFVVSPSTPLSVVPVERLSPAQVTALAAFVHWSEAGAAYSAPACGATTVSTLAIYRLGEASLATAADARGLDQVRAVLELARALRRRGGLAQTAVGFKLAELGAEWSHERDAPFTSKFERYRPHAVEIRRALAREAVCSDHLIVPAEGIGFAPRELLETSDSGPPFGLVRFARERLIFEQYYSRLLVRAEMLGDNWSAIADAYELAAKHRPRSVMLRGTMVPPGIIRNMGRAIDRYNALVPSH